MTDAQFSQFALRSGDVLLNEGQSLELVGRCAMYRDEYPEPCAIQNQLLRFRARPGVSGEFASHLFRFSQQSGVFTRVALQTTSIAHLGGKRFETLVLAWPSTEHEQRAIASALSDVDALLNGLDWLIVKKRDLKHAAMQQLVTGQTRLPGFRGAWAESTVGREFEIQLGKMLDAARNRGVPKPYVGNKAVQWGRVDLSELQTVPMTPAEMGRFRLAPGDLLVCEGGEVGRAAIWDQPISECYFQKAIHRLRPARGFNARFMLALLRHWADQGVLSDYVTQTSIAHLTREKFAQVPVPVPSREEQAAIAAVLVDMDAGIAALESRRDKTRALKQAMMQELLAGKTRLVAAGAVHG